MLSTRIVSVGIRMKLKSRSEHDEFALQRSRAVDGLEDGDDVACAEAEFVERGGQFVHVGVGLEYDRACHFFVDVGRADGAGDGVGTGKWLRLYDERILLRRDDDAAIGEHHLAEAYVSTGDDRAGALVDDNARSEERRVGKEWMCHWQEEQ